ncbi:MAG: acetolactate synthase [Phycisphaerae bacterium]|nr:acetolactate synthase [Phycisphaerae bacterium]
MNVEPFQTAEGSDFPYCRQLSIFLENRVGQLLRITRLFEDEPLHILGLSADASVDCAILRLLVDDPDLAHQILTDANFAVAESEILVVSLPPGKRGILTVFSALIAAEININYLYTLSVKENRQPGLAIQVDDTQNAIPVLREKQFRVLDQSEL